MSGPTPPKPRRRIAGESKPGDAKASGTIATPSVDDAEPAHPRKLAKPKLPKRPKAVAPAPAPAPATATATVDLPAAPPRAEALRVPPAKPSGRLVGLVVLAVVAIAFGGFGVWQGINQWRADNVATSREDASDAAAAAAETIFTFQYNKLDQYLRDSQKVMTPTFGKKFKDSGWKALTILAPQRRIQMKGVVRNAATIECGDSCSADRAKVLIFLDQARVTVDTDQPTVFGKRITVSMGKYDGKWLVRDIKSM